MWSCFVSWGFLVRNSIWCSLFSGPLIFPPHRQLFFSMESQFHRHRSLHFHGQFPCLLWSHQPSPQLHFFFFFLHTYIFMPQPWLWERQLNTYPVANETNEQKSNSTQGYFWKQNIQFEQPVLSETTQLVPTYAFTVHNQINCSLQLRHFWREKQKLIQFTKLCKKVYGMTTWLGDGENKTKSAPTLGHNTCHYLDFAFWMRGKKWWQWQHQRTWQKVPSSATDHTQPATPPERWQHGILVWSLCWPATAVCWPTVAMCWSATATAVYCNVPVPYCSVPVHHCNVPVHYCSVLVPYCNVPVPILQCAGPLLQCTG